MSVIVSRALPDVRDGLKPSQRRILVAMNDLGLGPDRRHQQVRRDRRRDDEALPPARRRVIYPTLVRMAQDWNMRHRLIDKQGNFGSIAGLPPAAMRYTEARLSPVAAEMLDDLELDTVDFIDNYDGKYREPLVLPGKFPNLLVNGSDGIAVGMATDIPPHNLARSLRRPHRADRRPGHRPSSELMEHHPRPRLPHRRHHLRPAGHPRRLPHRPRQGHRSAPGPTIDEEGKPHQIIITRGSLPADARPPARGDRRAGQGRAHQGHLATIRDESDRNGEPVRLVIDLKRDADPDLVLNQLYQFSPLQRRSASSCWPWSTASRGR